MPGLTKNDIDTVLKKLVDQGAKVETNAKSARKLILPGGKFVMVHSSPSDLNWEHQLRRTVEKSGLVWPLSDKKATKEAIKAFKKPGGSEAPPIPEGWTPPAGPIENVQEPPGVKTLGTRRPIDRQIELVRGALHAVNNPPTFWTAEVANLLTDQQGFRGGQATNIAQGVLHWLGYRVVEARPNRSGHIYRWALDPTKDRATQESLPIADLHATTTRALESEAPVEAEQPAAEVETPVEPAETPSEPQEPSDEVLAAARDAEERTRKFWQTRTKDEVARLEREKEALRQSATDDKRRAVDARRERDEARVELARLRGELVAMRDAPKGEATLGGGEWKAIEFEDADSWLDMQKWATKFGLDLEIRVKRADT